MADKLKALTHKRSALKGKLTNFENTLKKIEDDLDMPDFVDDKSALYSLQHRLDKFDKIIEEFEELQTEIELTNDSADADIKYRDDFETKYYNLIGRGRTIIDKLNPLKNEEDQLSVSSSTHDNENVNSFMNNVKLPTLSLPKFDGSIENWLEFRDSFTTVVINTNIKPIQKYQYLRASLSGSASNIINSLPISESTFETAWNLVCDRYDDKKELICNHVKALFHMSKITKPSSKTIRNLLDDSIRHVRCLKILGQPTDQWDVILVFLIREKLDSETFDKWEELTAEDETPSFEQLQTFLGARGKLLNTLESNTSKTKNRFNPQPNVSQSRSLVASIYKCPMCSESHKLKECKDFLKLTPESRFERTKSFKICINCFNDNHTSKNCRSKGCDKCSNKHNTLLHFEKREELEKGVIEKVSLSSCSQQIYSHDVLLSTAIIYALDKEKGLHKCRVLLDSGSQSNFVSSSFLSILNLESTSVEVSVVGINQVSSIIRSSCQVQIKSRINAFTEMVSCLVVPDICGSIPSQINNTFNLPIPGNLELADPTFNISSSIDMILGASLFWDLICQGQINLGKNLPILQSTRLGWIISGKIPIKQAKNVVCNLANIDLQGQLSRFWEIEELDNERHFSEEESVCEEHFIKTHKRNSNGRFIVSIPLSSDTNVLGDSIAIAERRFYCLEKRLQCNELLRNMYHSFMQEYLDLGHMSKLETFDDDKLCFLPHHGVLKEQSSTTKLRVVFNGSINTSSGIFLNDIQMKGPTIQRDLFSTLLQFRQHQFVVSADIVKMYRQILVDQSQRNLQCIFWRFSPKDPLSAYQLNTVTNGTTSASFLAIRCLKQISIENKEQFPLASEAILNDFYVDDLLTGSDDIEELIKTCHNISNLLQKACLPLRKWVSNNPTVVQSLAQSSTTTVNFGAHENTKTLGLLWSSNEDYLIYNVNIHHHDVVTKRSILSSIAQIFDPLGLLSPCIIKVKIILQLLWQNGSEWDEKTPDNIEQEWLNFQRNLDSLNRLKIKRCVLSPKRLSWEIHGFSDASERAYGACVYVRSIEKDGQIEVQLLCAKSKVAPLKTQTIPKLELCGALVLAKLIAKVLPSFSLKPDMICLWCDSTITLSWINSPVHLLKPFVANRVKEVQTLTTNMKWLHVCSSDNPADLLSRGISPELLNNCKMWWNGPEFLRAEASSWNLQFEYLSEVPETKKNTLVLTTIQEFDIFKRFSDFAKLKRIISYCIRFKSNCQSPKTKRTCGAVSSKEQLNAEMALIRLVQKAHFANDFKSLNNELPINRKSNILNLNPFLDKEGIIRVGGRLTAADLPYEKKFPILLPSKHPFVELLFQHQHKKLYHAGPQQLLFTIREKYWPLSGRDAAKRAVHNCIRCYKNKPKALITLMGNLPPERINPSFPFHIVGVDYAGPFSIKNKKGRGCKITKSYVAVFVCFVSKAIHIELVSDLTKDAFLASLRRFISRRGLPSEIRSDNGTNFVGTKNELNL